MTASLRLALTADLHWGSHPRGDEATGELVGFLRAEPPDVVVLAGDLGAGERFGECLALFDGLACRKALVPGNHDIWVTEGDPRGDSLQVYREYLPAVCAAHDFHYLDRGPLVIPDAGLAFVGCINWYDYSWSLDQLRQFEGWEERLRHKLFLRGRYNDARFVRWALDDVRFTREVVATFEQHLWKALVLADRVIVVTHHPPFYGLNYPRSDPPKSLDSLLWDAFSGNRALEALLAGHDDKVRFAFCGHTHRARENTLGAIRGYNLGGDYHFKRLVLLDWPEGKVEARVFGDPERTGR